MIYEWPPALTCSSGSCWADAFWKKRRGSAILHQQVLTAMQICRNMCLAVIGIELTSVGVVLLRRGVLIVEGRQ